LSLDLGFGQVGVVFDDIGICHAIDVASCV
jgi:hypothetical protein